MTPGEIPFRAAEQVRRKRDRRWKPPKVPDDVLRQPLPRWPVSKDALRALAPDWRASLRTDTDALLRSGFRLLGAWRLKTPLAWASCGLVIAVTLSLWSLGKQKPLEIVGEPLEPALMEEMRDPSWVHSESTTSSVAEQAENTTIWGD